MNWRDRQADGPAAGDGALPEVEGTTRRSATRQAEARPGPSTAGDGRPPGGRPPADGRSRGNWVRGLGGAALVLLLVAAVGAALRPSPVAHAQGAGASAHTITVMGTDQQSVAPDRADVTLGVTTLADTAAASQKQNSTTSAAVIAAIESSGVTAADIRTTGYDLSPRYRQPKPGAPEQISGFETAHTLTVTIRDIQHVGTVVDAAVAAGANRIEGVNYTVSDQSKIQLASYAGAVKDAQARADAIASALGVQLSGAYSVDATNSNWIRPVTFNAVAAPAAATVAPIQPGRQTIQTQVKVVFSFS